MHRMIKLRYILLIFLVLSVGRGCAFHSADLTSIISTTCNNPYIKQTRIIPGTPGIRVITQCGDYTFTDAKLFMAISLFVENYAETFEIPQREVWNMLSSLKIELSAIPKTVSGAYDINGKLVADVPVTGLALSKDYIWVEIRTSQIWSSSLAHELVHIIIWRANQVHGDPDHEGDQFSGWSPEHTQFIKRFNQDLLDLEI